jgi:chromosome segregation ATPase
MITNAERLKLAFSLFLTPAEAAIAAAASGTNPANNSSSATDRSSDREFFASLMEPIGEEQMIDMNHQATANRAADAGNVLSNMQYNLSRDEQRLNELSHDVVSMLGVLKKAEASLQKLGGANATVESRIKAHRAELDSLRQREDVASRIVRAAKALISQFLESGDPTNRELLEAAKDYEEAMQAL